MLGMVFAKHYVMGKLAKSVSVFFVFIVNQDLP